MEQNIFMCIDLKSFFASVECADRGLDPFTTNLVVSDPSRGNGAICLAITPAMKALGIRNRCRIFEIPPGVQYITAMPRMKRYMEVSAQVYGVYLRYISPEDIHVYSIDECFIDATPYLAMYNTSPKQLAQTLMNAVFEETHICAGYHREACPGSHRLARREGIPRKAVVSPPDNRFLERRKRRCAPSCEIRRVRHGRSRQDE